MFFPLKDENPTRNRPYATTTLIAINSLIWLYTAFLPARVFNIFLFKHGLIPYELIHLSETTPQYSAPILLSPFSSMFLHGGFLHLAGNMLYLWIFGNNIEDYFGPVKFIIFYLCSGLAAAFLFVLFSPNSEVPLVGASGAIAGILGAYFVLHPRARILTLIWIFFFIRLVYIPASFVLGFWFFYQLIMSAVASGSGGGVAWLAHVGGFIFGWTWFKFVLRKGRRQVVSTIES
jgi:membrane associated rhomboid family serine protease